ncbi:unnamed protein product [Pedinophyceae sp. YPF-701]|nr:unnamed protein product [Pedinophyceae sp. YPF-701]
MADVKDILGVPRDAGFDGAVKKEKPTGPTRPKGMSREAFALLDGSHPIIPSQLLGVKKNKGLKDKRKGQKGQSKWAWEPFKNSARSDGLQLCRWQQRVYDAQKNLVKDVPDDYFYAKFNKSVEVVQYNDEEYNSLLQDPDWTREETDHLLELCRQFGLRFVVVADRWGLQRARTVEDLKARYYGVARALIVARQGDDGATNQQLVRNPFNVQHEIERKRALEVLYQRTAREAREEDELLKKAKDIEDRRRAELLSQSQLDSAAGAGNVKIITELFVPEGQCSLVSPSLDFNWVPPGSYLRGAYTAGLAGKMKAGLTGGARVQKMMEQYMNDLGINTGVKYPTREVCANYVALIREITQVLEAKRRAPQQSLAQQQSSIRRSARAQGGDT